MEWEKVVDKIKDMIVGEIREELRKFKSVVTGQLSGFAIALESINARIASLESRHLNIESELKDVRGFLNEINKRIDETNERINDLFIEVSSIRGNLNKALLQKSITDNVIKRLQRLEDKVLTPV